MSEYFDVVVIGTGSAGTSAALACAQAGRTVAIVDERPFGGTCALRGCDPKKVLVGAEELVDWSRRAAALGAVSGDLRIDWPALMRFKRTFTDPVPPEREASYADARITAFHGAARFVGESAIDVGGTELEAANVVIAAGAAPVDLKIPGQEHIITSEDFLSLPALPRGLVFIGGGYISLEFAHLVARAGSKATILHRGARPLEQFDPDLVGRLVDATRELGIDVQLGVEVTGVERDGAHFVVRAKDGTYPADLVVHGAGRVPQIEALALDAGKVERTAKGIRVNAFLQSTSNPRVYAAGDAAASGGPPLTPVAAFTGEVAAHNLLGGNQRRVDFEAVPSIVYTTPTLAAVGMSEADARASVKELAVHSGDMASWYSYRRIGEKTAAYKTLIHMGEDRLLGAHVLGSGAEQLVNLFAMAIQCRIPVARLRDMLLAYPTYGSDIPYLL